MTGAISEDTVNAEKFKRLRELRYITDDNKVNIMVLKGDHNEFLAKYLNLTKKRRRNSPIMHLSRLK